LTPKEAYQKAGRIASSVLRFAADFITEGMSIEEICETLEEKIRNGGGQPAFPCNISQNDEAAHYSASPGDRRRIEKAAIVKVDVGVHVEGYIADSAITVNFNPTLQEMASANRAILMVALKTIRRDVGVSVVGEVVESEAAKRGFKPITNLAGHQLDQYVIHSGVSVPNSREKMNATFRLNSAYAIEPFLVPARAKGWVENGPPGNIYRLVSRKRTKDRVLGEALDFVWENYRSLPFSSRWFVRGFGRAGALEVLDALLKQRLVMTYPILVEASGAPVSQFEHTVFVDEQETIVTTI
jgi:methionyl aminopeptidase